MVNVLRFWVAVWAVAVSTLVAAHGAGYEVAAGDDAVVLRFAYSVGEPMADTDIVVTAPDGETWQRARTDAAGRFSLVPAVNGTWRVTADDGLGHEVVAELQVSAEGLATGEGPTHVTLPPLLVYGLLLASLLLNGALIWRARRH